mmetsp:Transcript_12993/g.19461  ORF Transcript_12993/g.19461 Transcript_12993/m.19461 type:complete len:278 (+) Transcript_12993:1-834(+)
MSKKRRTRRNPNDRNHQALFTYTRSLPSYEIADLIEGKAKKFKSNVSAKLFDQDQQHIKEALANIIGSSPQREKSFATYYTTTLQPLLHQIIAEKQESEKVGSSMNRYGAEHFPQPNFQPVPVIGQQVQLDLVAIENGPEAWLRGLGSNAMKLGQLCTDQQLQNDLFGRLQDPAQQRVAFIEVDHLRNEVTNVSMRSGDVRNAYTDIEERAKNDIAEINIQIEELVRARAIQETTVKKVEKCRLTVDSVFTKSIQGGNNVLTQIENHIKKPTAPATY